MSNLVAKIITTSDEFLKIQKEWNNLLSHSASNSCFLRWEWLWFWWRFYSNEDRTLCIVVISSNGKIAGIGPFYVEKKRLLKNLVRTRRLKWLGTNEGSMISEHMGTICRKGEEDPVNQMIIKYLLSESLCDELYLHSIAESSVFFESLRQVIPQNGLKTITVNRMESPYIKIPTNYEAFLKGLSASLRSKVRRQQKRLRGYDNVVFRKTSNLDEFQKDFDELVRLHQLRWESRNLPGSFSKKTFFDFQSSVMLSLLKENILELYFLSIDGRNIAALYNMQYDGKTVFFQAGLDPSFDSKLSPGLLLHDHCIRLAIESCVAEYDFLAMGKLDAYKKQLAKESRQLSDLYLTPSLSLFCMTFLIKKIFGGWRV